MKCDILPQNTQKMHAFSGRSPPGPTEERRPKLCWRISVKLKDVDTVFATTRFTLYG